MLFTLLLVTSTAEAHPLKKHSAKNMPLAPVLHMVHWFRDRTWHWQRLDPTAKRTRYYWVADRHSTPKAQRQKIARNWYLRSVRAHRHYQHYLSTRSSVPSWFRSAMGCISINEEYGVDGPNTSAGYFGFIYSPASYIEPGPTLASRYGNSWLSVPLEGQYEMAWGLYRAYGWDPWSTADDCGYA